MDIIQEASQVDKQKDRTQSLILCPVWHRPIFRIVPTGIEIKCKFCGGLIHTIPREEIERHWSA